MNLHLYQIMVNCQAFFRAVTLHTSMTEPTNKPDLLNTVQSLNKMTEAALERLSRNSNGFILQFEGGRINRGAHGNNRGGLIYDQIASPILNRFLNGYEATEIEFDRIHDFNFTNDWVFNGLEESSSVNYIRERLKEATRIGMTSGQTKEFQQGLRDENGALYEMISPPDTIIGAIMANNTSGHCTGTRYRGI
ncbi:hypothetical protein BH23BAC3_BH23BAC3_27660 [soil metagenome]